MAKTKRRTKKQIVKFLRRASTYQDLPVYVKMFTDKSETAYGAYTWTYLDADQNAVMCVKVNTDIQTEWSEILLHELGHFELEHYFVSSRPLIKHEFEAQLWAARRAEELGWNRMAERLMATFDEWSNNTHWWNTPYRRYVLAGRMAKERGIV